MVNLAPNARKDIGGASTTLRVVELPFVPLSMTGVRARRRCRPFLGITRFESMAAAPLRAARAAACRLLFFLLPSLAQTEPANNDYYRLLTYELPEGLHLEASGLALLPDGRLAVSIRRGEVWLLDHPEAEPPTAERVGYHLFASGLHELLGLAWHDGALYTTQRCEITRLRDTDGDGVADEYFTFASGWGVSGNYHEYAYGPVFDSNGNAYTTLNSSLGEKWPGAGEEAQHTLWRGWCVVTPPGGRTQPVAAGFRDD